MRPESAYVFLLSMDSHEQSFFVPLTDAPCRIWLGRHLSPRLTSASKKGGPKAALSPCRYHESYAAPMTASRARTVAGGTFRGQGARGMARGLLSR